MRIKGKTNSVLTKIDEKVNSIIVSNEATKKQYQDAYDVIVRDIRAMTDKMNSCLDGDDPEEYAVACETVRKLKDKANFYKCKMNSVPEGITDVEYDSIMRQLKDEFRKTNEEYKKRVLELADAIIDETINMYAFCNDARSIYSNLCICSNREAKPNELSIDNVSQFSTLICHTKAYADYNKDSTVYEKLGAIRVF